VGIDLPVTHFTSTGGICEPHSLTVAAGLGQCHEHPGVNAARRLLRERRNNHTGQGIDSPTQTRRHHLNHFAQGSNGRFFDISERSGLNCRVQSDPDGYRLFVIQEERRKHCAGGQLVTTLRTPLGLNGVAQDSEAVDVTSERPSRYF
jgi:hypothetical protein